MEEFESVSEETVLWTAENVRKRLTNLQNTLSEAKTDIDKEKKKDENDVGMGLLVFLGACMLYPVILILFHNMPEAFKTVLLPVFLVGSLVMVFVTGRNFLNALTTYSVRSCTNLKRKFIEKIGAATYRYETVFYEEQFLRISKFIKEVDELVRRAHMRGSLSDKEFDRLNMLQYVQVEKMTRNKKSITFGEWIKAVFKSSTAG